MCRDGFCVARFALKSTTKPALRPRCRGLKRPTIESSVCKSSPCHPILALSAPKYPAFVPFEPMSKRVSTQQPQDRLSSIFHSLPCAHRGGIQSWRSFKHGRFLFMPCPPPRSLFLGPSSLLVSGILSSLCLCFFTFCIHSLFFILIH